MADFFIELLNFLSIEMIIPIISMVPLIELRGAIPIGIIYGLNPWLVLLITYPASLLPAPFIIVFIKTIFRWLSRNQFFAKVIQKIVVSNEQKHRHKIEKYGLIGLFIIVAIPLPGTGVWSGSLAAVLFNFKFGRAMVAIILGNLVAAIAITLITMQAMALF